MQIIWRSWCRCDVLFSARKHKFHWLCRIHSPAFIKVNTINHVPACFASYHTFTEHIDILCQASFGMCMVFVPYPLRQHSTQENEMSICRPLLDAGFLKSHAHVEQFSHRSYFYRLFLGSNLVLTVAGSSTASSITLLQSCKKVFA